MIKIVEEERVVYSVVCAPGIKDSDGEILTAEEIRHAQQKFMEEYQHIDKDHDYARYSSFENVGNVVESYITENDTTKKALNGEELAIPAGSWIIGIKITNNDLLHKIKNGIYPGVSVTGVPAAAKSKTLIGDLGKGWKAKTVSIVQEPANPIALFFAIKEKGGNEKMVDYKNFYETIASAIKQVSEEKEENKDIEEESTKAEEEIKEDEKIVDKSCDDKKVSKAEEEPSEDEEVEKAKEEPSEDEDVEKAKDFEKKVDEKADMMVSEDELESKIAEAIREKEAINKMVKDLDVRLSLIEEALNKSDKIEETEEEVKEEVSEKAEEEVKEESESKEEDEKDKKIAELEAKIKELENKTASKSKSLSINNNVAEKQKSVSLYEKLGRDCMGRKL